MKINADFNQRAVVHSQQSEWLSSPMPGVARRPLDRVGDEVARATTIVRYDPGSHFSPHVHTGGEEFIVLEGVFQDEHGDFPVGSYIRNPPQSRHTPGSEPGCIIFVKLWQFEPSDRTHVRLNTNFMTPVSHHRFEGVAITPLYTDAFEDVTLYTCDAGARLSFPVAGGAELFVLDGQLTEGKDSLQKHSWLRVPQNSSIDAVAGNNGAVVWIKQGHLAHVETQIERLVQAI